MHSGVCQEHDPNDEKAERIRAAEGPGGRGDGDLIETPGERPVIAVTLGDPAGIGPEVVLKALMDPAVAPLAAWTIVGDRDELARAGEACGISLSSLRGVTVRHLDALHGEQVVPGRSTPPAGAPPSPTCAKPPTCACGARRSPWSPRRSARRRSRSPEWRSPATPSSSRNVAASRFPHDAHQPAPLGRPRLDAHAAARGGRRAAGTHHADDRPGRRGDALAGQRRAAHRGVRHESARERAWPVRAEEQNAIGPAIEAAKAHGVACHGPFAPDTNFLDAWQGKWDVVIAMYHDRATSR